MKNNVMRNSKTILSICGVMLCILTLAMSSCKNSPMSKLGEQLSDSEMEQLVNELNESCPINYEIGTATGFK